MERDDGLKASLHKYVCMKEIMSKTRSVDMENLFGLQEMSMKENMIMMKEMVLES